MVKNYVERIFKDMTGTYKQIQLTNTAIGDVAVDGFIPLGRVTRRINSPQLYCNTFTVNSSSTDTVVINDPGFYKVTYSLTGSAAAEGSITIALVVNGEVIYDVSEYLIDASANVNITLPYTIRVYSECSSNSDKPPVSIQIQNTGVALTGTSGNLMIERI